MCLFGIDELSIGLRNSSTSSPKVTSSSKGLGRVDNVNRKYTLTTETLDKSGGDRPLRGDLRVPQYGDHLKGQRFTPETLSRESSVIAASLIDLKTSVETLSTAVEKFLHHIVTMKAVQN